MAGRVGMSNELRLGCRSRIKGLGVQRVEIFLHRALGFTGVSHTGCPAFGVARVLFLDISIDQAGIDG